jgi:ABC-type transport system involved in multi-copper enzyme maturation permease subunit
MVERRRRVQENGSLRISPVFHCELMAIARRERYYVTRWIYGLCLLVCICSPIYSEWGLSSSQEMEHRRLAALNEEFFVLTVVVQGLAVLILTPALVGGAVAEEKQRRGLEILLTTTLSSTEIVLGKLAARTCLLVVILLVTAPVFCLLSLNGGVDVGLVALSYGGTLTTGFLIAAMAIFVSTLSDRPLRAIMATYLLVIAWLVLPFLPNPFGTGPGPPGMSSWIGEGMVVVQRWVGLTNPFYVASGMSWSPSRELVVGLLWVMAAQVGVAALLIVAAAAVLRPLARRAGSSALRFKLFSLLLSRRSLLPRRGCGDRPMLWKECHVARTTVLTRLVIVLAILGIAISTGPATWKTFAAAFSELRDHGYGAQAFHPARDELNLLVRVAIVILYIAMALVVAVRSALNFTSEIEKETWTSLIATPLDATEVLSGKMLGTFWGLRWLGWIYLAFVALGLAAGAIHPSAGVFVLLELPIFLAFAAVLGTAFSLSSKSSVFALGGTMLTLLVINGGYLMCCLVVAHNPGIFFAMTPLIQGLTLATYGEVERQLNGDTATEIGFVILLSLLCYVPAVFALLGFCKARFEIVADRPRRDNPLTRGPSRRVNRKVGRGPNLIERDDSES